MQPSDREHPAVCLLSFWFLLSGKLQRCPWVQGSAFWCSLSVLARVISKQRKAFAIQCSAGINILRFRKGALLRESPLCPLCRLGCMDPEGSRFVSAQVPSCRCSGGGGGGGHQLWGRAGRCFAAVEALGWSLALCLAAPSSWVLV